MILEIADIRVLPGTGAEFEQAAQRGLTTVFPNAQGFLGHEVRHSTQPPSVEHFSLAGSSRNV
jgi:heme-degrading monooxygenase HmoA